MNLKALRAMILDGATDEEIAEAVDAGDFESAAYGSPDADCDGPAHLHDDGYYSRNDAGEYAWM